MHSFASIAVTLVSIYASSSAKNLNENNSFLSIELICDVFRLQIIYLITQTTAISVIYKLFILLLLCYCAVDLYINNNG